METPILDHKCIRRPKRSEIIILRFLVLIGLILVCQFVLWYIDDDHIGQPILFWMLSFALGYKLLHILYQWYNYIAMSAPTPPKITRRWSVDMLTTHVAGEPKQMLLRTLNAMVNVRYPHTTYLCDEADDPELKEICRELGVVHVYRGKDKTDAKAGNINYALRNHAHGEIAIIIDPDHIPIPEFIDRVLPYFEDDRVGFVQCIQAYYNQRESLIARGAAEQTYMFYGPMMLGMQSRGTVQAIGANCTFRRAALDSIGGHANGLCEDMHTSMRIHSKGWTSVYVPEMLTRGMTPSSISAYYHQQLKWSRGTFQLLFEVYPKLFRGFTWRQRIHYFLMPLYFLAGVITFIDIGVPIFSLLTFHVPLFIDFSEFALRILPVLISISLVRHYVQRFILDQHEEGFHFIGGIQRVGTWWVYLLGFIYAIFRIKVPYTPTRKDHGVNDHWYLSLPNVAVILMSFLAVLYGLQQDFTPYTWVMAGFAGVNILLLTFIVVVSQQKTLAQTRRYVPLERLNVFREMWFKFRYLIFYKLLRNSFFSSLLILLAFVFSFRAFFGLEQQHTLADLYSSGNKVMGVSLISPERTTPNNHSNPPVVVLSLEDSDNALIRKVTTMLSDDEIRTRVPFVKLSFNKEFNPTDSVSHQRGLLRFDSLLYAFRQFQRPLFLQPVFQTDDGEASAMLAYEKIKGMIQKQGAGNVSLAWYRGAGNSDPVPAGADLIVVDAKSSGGSGNVGGSRKDKKPILLVSESGTQEENSKLLRTKDNNEELALGWISENAYEISPRETDSLHFHAGVQRSDLNKNDLQKSKQPLRNKNVNSVLFRSATAGIDSQWYVAGKPFYIKGVVYNPEHTWRDGRWPLTRRRLQGDFAKIKSMGGNTVSREKPTIYDKNILQVAEEMELRVIYGFSFDPEIDYLTDTATVNRITREIVAQVELMKRETAILAWNLGTGTWEQLADRFYQPYVTDVRLAYMRMIGNIARRIKEVDPLHPIFTSFLGDDDFRAALDDVELALPHVDAVALNASDPQQLAHVQTTLDEWDMHVPYLYNGFGLKVNNRAKLDDKNRIVEPSSYEKARLYGKLWKEIEQGASHNLGGLAYCWRDRFEGTATYSGITDSKGRLKPAYFSLKEVWTGEKQTFPLSDVTLKFETIFSNESFNLVYDVMSANNLNRELTYQWFICREEYLERIYSLRVDYNSFDYLKFRVVNEYNENIARTLHLPTGKPAVWYYQEKAKPLQRIYLYIYDDDNNVVTASFPIYADNETHD